MPIIQFRDRASGEYPITPDQIRYRLRALVSFGPTLDVETAAQHGYDAVTVDDQPECDPRRERIVEHSPQIIAGQWAQGWSVEPLDAQTLADNLAAERAGVWEQIKALRDQRKAAGVLVGSKWYHSDDSSRIQQLGLVMMGSSVPAVPWKTMDGSFVTMSQALAMQIFQATAASDMAVFARAEALRAAVDAAADPLAVDIQAGWPPVHGESA